MRLADSRDGWGLATADTEDEAGDKAMDDAATKHATARVVLLVSGDGFVIRYPDGPMEGNGTRADPRPGAAPAEQTPSRRDAPHTSRREEEGHADERAAAAEKCNSVEGKSRAALATAFMTHLRPAFLFEAPLVQQHDPAGVARRDRPLPGPRLLGGGTFGAVYRAFDPRLDREVALKVLRPEMTTVARRSSGSCARPRRRPSCSHPHIVPVHDTGCFGGVHYIVSAFIDGRTLASAIAEGGMEPCRAAELTAQLASAPGPRPPAGMLHRDVKPANAMLDERGPCT